MAVTVKQMAMIVAFFGVLSFIFGIIAENKKLENQCRGKMLLFARKSLPQAALFRSKSFVVFFNISLLTAGLAAALLLWTTITEQLHLSRNVHHNLKTDCPTAKTGLLGGGAFVSLDSALFWLVALMLADNAREDYFEESDKDVKGSGYTEVHGADYGQHVVKGSA
ncbi:hypothetical protein RchiOBHm_Chr6g0312401 [Rosa chinensis]|uniref:Uncharacterized protein n=1 Tax=Rosa chinensis TaxID=74649 RepID=A0A2P6Q1N5_ROSCH|nr:hypothetical protein RchiOBHm_Chr6g0312401 [Rosa chinensis]